MVFLSHNELDQDFYFDDPLVWYMVELGQTSIIELSANLLTTSSS